MQKNNIENTTRFPFAVLCKLRPPVISKFNLKTPKSCKIQFSNNDGNETGFESQFIQVNEECRLLILGGLIFFFFFFFKATQDYSKCVGLSACVESFSPECMQVKERKGSDNPRATVHPGRKPEIRLIHIQSQSRRELAET